MVFCDCGRCWCAFEVLPLLVSLLLKPHRYGDRSMTSERTVVLSGTSLHEVLLAHVLVVSVGKLSKPAVNLLVGGELPVLLACMLQEGGTEASPRLRNIPLALALVGPALVWVRSELGVAQEVWMQGLWLQEGCVAQEVWM